MGVRRRWFQPRSPHLVALRRTRSSPLPTCTFAGEPVRIRTNAACGAYRQKQPGRIARDLRDPARSISIDFGSVDQTGGVGGVPSVSPDFFSPSPSVGAADGVKL